MMRRAVGICVALVCACDAAPVVPQRLTHTHRTMGSEVRVTVVSERADDVRLAASAVFAEFDRLDGLLSVWKADSDVSRMNTAAGDAPVRVSRETIDVLKVARQVSTWTEGKFDVTFGALSDVWKFDHDQDGRVPTAEEIAARLPLIDYTAIAFDEAARTALVARPRMRVHLGGIGKGYAIDRGAAILRSAGFADFLIQAGGDLYASGRAGAEPWRVGIADPRNPEDSFASVELNDATFSTSGDYERAFVKDGVRYHHLLDPDSGQPAHGCVSVTIVSRSAVLADALSTGVFILGPERGMALIERLDDVEGILVTSGNDVLVSTGLQGRLRVSRTPTARRP